MAEKEAKELDAICKDTSEERNHYMEKAENLEKTNKALTEESIEMDEKLANSTEQSMKLAEFITLTGTKHKDEAMLRMAKQILGVKRYITYKLTNNIELTEEDKKLIMQIIK
ncbi:hypothetical protein [Prevotella sp. 885]|uniref:hypothetical protein n=1 Tax=Prevotella sp. 885 TaxID=2022527 RepID=UPI000BA02117|nr:hypothetical protein [Prevotella sp. 885]OZT04946.1 hypothetical protein CHL74_01800 [Prevotella sp. 885]